MENILLNLIDDVLGLEDEQKETWKIEDDLTADWCLDKIRESKVRYNRFEMVVNDKIQQLQYALNEEKKKIENEIGFFESKLREYFNTVENLANETKTQKSYKLPGGQLKVRKATLVFDYDKDKLLEYAKETI